MTTKTTTKTLMLNPHAGIEIRGKHMQINIPKVDASIIIRLRKELEKYGLQLIVHSKTKFFLMQGNVIIADMMRDGSIFMELEI